jgi:hypothetical protein
MKQRGFLLGCLMCVLGGLAGAQSNSNANWVGVWEGKLEGMPGVTLTLGNDTGELGGTIVFNAVDSAHNRIIANSTHLLMHPHIEGNTLSFEVKGPDRSQAVHVTVKLTDDGKAELVCLDCGSDRPATELVKTQYTKDLSTDR